MHRLPPGLVYLASSLPQLSLPPLYAISACYFVKFVVGVAIPAKHILLACLLSWPIGFVVGVQLRNWRVAREAKAAGAVLPPRVESHSITGKDIVNDMIRDSETKFLGHRHTIWIEKYGHTFNMRALFADRFYTVEPEYIKRILATEFENYEKGRDQAHQLEGLLGNGVFTSDGELWKFHRGMTRPFFSRDRISHFDIFDRHAHDLLRLLGERMAEGQPVDWQDLVSRFTLDSATEFLFGQDVRSLSAALPYPPKGDSSAAPAAHAELTNKFSDDFLQAQIATANRSRYGKAWPLWEFGKDKVADHMRSIDELIGRLCREAMQRKAQNEKAKEAGNEEEEGETLLEHLVNLTDDVQIIRDETLNILLAGRDTTGSTMTSAVYMLAEHPDILQRLRTEIAEQVGMRRPTYEDIKDMRYLRAFINEVLRLYPPVPFNVRYAIKGTVWPSQVPGEKPFYIPGGTRCIYSVLIMHRRKDLWGPDALKFDPDRFIDDRLHRYLTPNPFIFVPFNAGPRICLGQQFAYNEVSFMLIRLLQNVSGIHLMQEVNPKAIPPAGYADSPICEGGEKAFFRNHLTLYVQGGLWIKMDQKPLAEE